MTAEFAGKASSATAARTSRMECTLDNDTRLLASLGAVIAHAARRAGLPEPAQEEMTHAAVEAAREMMKAENGKGTGASGTKFILDEFSDRLELTIETSGGAGPQEIRKRLEGKFGDRVRWEGRDGRARVTLIKPCGVAKSGSAS
jgi:anti-sigma regulatory factor (Ser/Thr protein kinase)